MLGIMERGLSAQLEERLYIGPAGWQYEDWNGIFYPSPRPRGFDALEYVASYFNLDEINSTFYRVPAPETCRTWAERVTHNPRFLFTAKAHQALTHGPDDRPREIDAFRAAMEPLAEARRLGCVLLQFPWSFRFDDNARRRVDTLVPALHPLPLAIEVRHASWDHDDADAFLAGHGVAVCGIDQPVIGESRPPLRFQAGPAGAYFRFHGRNNQNWFGAGVGRDARYDYLYSPDELSPWAGVIRRAAADNSRVFVVLNNHFRGQAPANAFELGALLTGKRPPAPSTLRRAFPRLSESTTAPDDPSATGDLFGA
jgi:uncharacterized protein YecE (DUF72 family)